MTDLEAALKDFALQRDGDRDLSYHFRLAGSEDFSATIAEFKDAIPAGERKPDPGANWLWWVKASASNHAALARIFDNFAELYDTAKSQLALF